jgi:hypothetical protein
MHVENLVLSGDGQRGWPALPGRMGESQKRTFQYSGILPLLRCGNAKIHGTVRDDARQNTASRGAALWMLPQRNGKIPVTVLRP